MRQSSSKMSKKSVPAPARYRLLEMFSGIIESGRLSPEAVGRAQAARDALLEMAEADALEALLGNGDEEQFEAVWMLVDTCFTAGSTAGTEGTVGAVRAVG